MAENEKELIELMEWATTRDAKTPMQASDTSRLLEHLDTIEKRGILLVVLREGESDSMKTEMTVQVDGNVHPMVKLMTLVAKALMQDFFMSLKDHSDRPNPAKITIQHFIKMTDAAMRADKLAREAEEIKEESKDA